MQRQGHSHRKKKLNSICVLQKGVALREWTYFFSTLIMQHQGHSITWNPVSSQDIPWNLIEYSKKWSSGESEKLDDCLMPILSNQTKSGLILLNISEYF